MPKHTLQINAYHKYGFSKGYVEGDHESSFKFVNDANNNFVNLLVGYGISKKVTVQAEAGYYLNRTQNFNILNQNYSLNGSGGASAIFTGKYNIWKDTLRGFEFTMGLGGRIPWSLQPQVVNGVELSEDVQPSNAAYGISIQSFLFKEFDSSGVSLFLINNVNISSENPRHYREGNTYITSLMVSKSFLDNFSGLLQVRNEVREHSYRDGIKVTSSGGYRFILVPQLNFRFLKKYSLSVLYELPIYQYYYGIQLNDRYAFSINLNARLGKSANESCVKPR